MPALPGGPIAASLQMPTFYSVSNKRVVSATLTNDPGIPTGSSIIMASCLLLAQITLTSTVDTVAAPAGWTKPASGGPIDTTAGNQVRSYLMTAPGNVATTNFTKVGANGGWRVSILALYGASAIDVFGSASSSANGTNVASSGYTATVADHLRLVLVGYFGTQTVTPPAGFALGELYEQNNAGGPSHQASADYKYAAGAVAGVSNTLSTNAGWVVFDVGVKA